MEYKYGLMELSTRVIGARTKQTEKENSGMLMEMFMKESGKMTKPMVMEYMFMSMVQGMKEIGRMIYKMAGELKVGQITLNTRENIKRA